jgi:peptidoglycan hydrolase-like protein with peptidoglycan-binding domain
LVAAGAVLVGPASVATASPTAVQQAEVAAPDPGVLFHCDELANHPTIRRGSTGIYVGHAQCLLKYHYGQNIAVDRDFGPATEQAVRNVQAVCGLVVDGIIGPNTWRVLHRNGTC